MCVALLPATATTSAEPKGPAETPPLHRGGSSAGLAGALCGDTETAAAAPGKQDRGTRQGEEHRRRCSRAGEAAPARRRWHRAPVASRRPDPHPGPPDPQRGTGTAPAAARGWRQPRRRLQLPPSISPSLIPQWHFGTAPGLGTGRGSSAASLRHWASTAGLGAPRHGLSSAHQPLFSSFKHPGLGRVSPLWDTCPGSPFQASISPAGGCAEFRRCCLTVSHPQ